LTGQGCRELEKRRQERGATKSEVCQVPEKTATRGRSFKNKYGEEGFIRVWERGGQCDADRGKNGCITERGELKKRPSWGTVPPASRQKTIFKGMSPGDEPYASIQWALGSFREEGGDDCVCKSFKRKPTEGVRKTGKKQSVFPLQGGEKTDSNHKNKPSPFPREKKKKAIKEENGCKETRCIVVVEEWGAASCWKSKKGGWGGSKEEGPLERPKNFVPKDLTGDGTGPNLSRFRSRREGKKRRAKRSRPQDFANGRKELAGWPKKPAKTENAYSGGSRGPRETKGKVRRLLNFEG